MLVIQMILNKTRMNLKALKQMKHRVGLVLFTFLSWIITMLADQSSVLFWKG